jgi:hypothetical protein
MLESDSQSQSCFARVSSGIHVVWSEKSRVRISGEDRGVERLFHWEWAAVGVSMGLALALVTVVRLDGLEMVLHMVSRREASSETGELLDSVFHR